jgi:RNA polymerase sigma-70 factor (ECF subfamily)
MQLMLEDELLKWQFKNGSKEALCRIYEKYLNYLLTVAMSLVNDTNRAEDIVHDVFVSFARTADHFTLRGSLKSYLATAVVNRVRDVFRKNHRMATTVDIYGIDLPDTHSTEPDTSVLFTEEAHRLSQALSELPPEQRESVVLHIKGRMKFKEIAKLQNVSINTVQGRYRYGLAKLRSILDGEFKDETDR